MSAKDPSRNSTGLMPVAPVLASIVGGAVSVILGVLVLVWPGATLKVGAGLFGLQLILIGGLRVALGVFARGLEAWVRPVHVIAGLLVAIAGIVCVRHPVLSVVVIVVTIAVGWLVEGVALLTVGVHAERGRLPLLAAGTLSIAAGGVMLVSPVSTTSLLLTLGGWLLIVIGLVSMVGVPWVMREARTHDPRIHSGQSTGAT